MKDQSKRGSRTKEEAVAFLKRVRELLENGWTQGCMARTRGGRQVSVDSPLAARFCLYGAYDRAGTDPCGAWVLLTKSIQDLTGSWKSLQAFNDEKGRKKPEVIAVVDGAIELAKKGKRRQR